MLEQLRLLTNLETSERKLLQIILIGQPELRDMLARPELEQLAQRVIARYHLSALSAKETAQYIHHRLIVAGLTRAAPFDRDAVQRIHALSRGVPRRINLLCDRALLGAYAERRGDRRRDHRRQSGARGASGARAQAGAPATRVFASLAAAGGDRARCGARRRAVRRGELDARCDARCAGRGRRIHSIGEVKPRCPTSSKH